MELLSVNNKKESLDLSNTIITCTEAILPSNQSKYKVTPFIEANTTETTLNCLTNDCIIPVFAKDNERTISHQEFVEVSQDCITSVFKGHILDNPELRASHIIKGRIPDAIHKPAKELLDFEKTQYFERLAFAIRIPSISEEINGNRLALVVGGVRAYNKENLYSKKSIEKFQVFIGFQNMVCCNLSISTDGFAGEMRVASIAELRAKIMQLFSSFQAEIQIRRMREFTKQYLTESQFAQLIGKMKLYSYLPKGTKQALPQLLVNDGQISTIAKDFYQDKRFCQEDGRINLWEAYNLFTSANKSSYIDTFLSRNVNSLDFISGVSQALTNDNYHWFLE